MRSHHPKAAGGLEGSQARDPCPPPWVPICQARAVDDDLEAPCPCRAPCLPQILQECPSDRLHVPMRQIRAWMCCIAQLCKHLMNTAERCMRAALTVHVRARCISDGTCDMPVLHVMQLCGCCWDCTALQMLLGAHHVLAKVPDLAYWQSPSQ